MSLTICFLLCCLQFCLTLRECIEETLHCRTATRAYAQALTHIRNAGISHIIVASGFHLAVLVGIVMATIMFLFRCRSINRRHDKNRRDPRGDLP